MILVISRVFGVPTGICLFAASPETPANQVQAFELDHYEKTTEMVRCFLANGSNVVITKYKFRGIIPYPSQILGADPKLPKQIDLLNAYVLKYPGTLPFLKPRIDRMTTAIDSAVKSAELERIAELRKAELARIAEQRNAEQRREEEKLAEQQRLAREAEAKRLEEFSASQIKKGLAEYRGKWLPRAEVDNYLERDKAAEFKARIEAQLLAEERAVAAEAQRKAAASTFMFRGTVKDFTSEGMLVFSNYGNLNMPNAIEYHEGRPAFRYGHFLLTGHPEQNNKINDSWFDVDAIYEGVFEYTTILGATRRVQRFRVVKSYY